MITDGLDNGVVKHFLVFNSDGFGRVEIIEPVGFDGADFTFKQEKDRYGRDVSFAGGEVQFTFYKLTNYRGITHQFERLIEYRNTYGYESEVQYIIQYDGVDHIVGELDFEASTTDNYEKFECKVIQDQLEAVIKRNKGVNVNLLSDVDVNNEAIEPIEVQKVLVKATPLSVVSEWSMPTPVIFKDNDARDPTSIFGFSPQIVRSDIANTLSPFSGFDFSNDRAEDCVYIEAIDNLIDLEFKISNFNYAVNFSGSVLKIIIRVGVDFNDAQDTEIVTPIPNNDNNGNYTFRIPEIKRNERLWCYVFVENTAGFMQVRIDSAEVSLTATSNAIDSVSNSIRLIDAMEQVTASISGATVDAPEFQQGGILYDNFLILGNQLRNIDITTFDITFEDILKGIKEFDADYEVQADGSVYFGTRDTFYKDERLETFTIHPSNTFNKAVNPRFAINTFEFSYDHYEKGQNESLENSREGIHTESQYKLPNKRVVNKKEVKCPWGRDPFEIEKVRRQGLKVSDETSQENDDDIFIIDVYNETGSIPRTESFSANHVISDTIFLDIINDGSFNWSISGISIGDTVVLSGENAGNYYVSQIGEANLTLVAVFPQPDPTFQGVAYTTLAYNVTSTDLVIATDQEFSTVVGATDREGFANMSYSIARNTRRFFGTYLKTASYFHPLGLITNTLFKYNGDFYTKKIGETVTVVENANLLAISLPEAILTTETTEVEVICDYLRFRALVAALRTQRGYVTVLDHNQNEINIYPQELTFNWKEHKLYINGEDKKM